MASLQQAGSRLNGRPVFKTDYLDLFHGLVIAVRLGLLDVQHHVCALDHAPKHRVLVVEPWGRDRCDEELQWDQSMSIAVL